MSDIYVNYFEKKHGKKEEKEKVYSANYFAAKNEDEKDPEYKAQDLMLNRPKAAYDLLKAIPESGAGLVKDAIRFAADPKGVLSGGVDAMKQFGNKLGRKAAELQYGQEMDVMPERGEIIADTAWEGIKERFGGGDELATTLMTDPVGLALDVGVAKPFRGIEPMSATSSLLDKAATGMSKAAYADAVGIPKKLRTPERQALVETGMDTGVTVNRKGLDALEAAQLGISDDINKIINIQGKNDRFKVQGINSNLDDLMRSYEGTSGGNAKIAKVKQLKADLNKEFIWRDTNGNPILDMDTGQPRPKDTISAAEMQKYKTDMYTQVYKREADVNTKRAESPKTKTMKQQGRAAKYELERTYPELIDPNIKWGKLAKLKPMVERAMEKFTELDSGMIPYLSKKVRDPEWRSRMAIGLRKLADGDIKGMENTLHSSANIRIALVMAGRNEQMIDEELTISDGISP